MGKPLLIPGPANLWLLAHVTPQGTQPTFYNFETIAAGLAFCAEHGEAPFVEVDGRRLRPSAIRILLAIADGAATLNAARRRGKAGALHAMLARAELEAAGWLTIEAGAGRRGSDALQLTPAGLELAARMRRA